MAIRVLPTHLVNKIAAGEVIERPASIVKELVENSLDAGATRIDVTIEDGGRKLISVTDDGCGMSADDLALAFRPHATSKLADEEALYRIATMGFRGEALASVASVSHAQMRTCESADGRTDAAQAGGHEIDAAGDKVGEVRPCAAAPGTTVTIRDLFFNTPARRKFLRSANTEAGHVAEQITRLALPHSEVAFTLTHNGRTVHSLAPCESTRVRVAELFGAELADSLLGIVSRAAGPARVSGLIGPPSAARGSGKWQYLFLNGRYIRDRQLSHAVREAYRGRLDPNRWPVVFVFLDVAPGDVDINVHPTKIEVRFRDSQFVHGELLAALRETLNKANLAPTATLDAPGEDAQPGDPEQQAAQEERRASLRQALADFFKSAPPPQPRLSFPEDTPLRRPARGGQGGPPAPPPGALPLGQPASPPAAAPGGPALATGPVPAGGPAAGAYEPAAPARAVVAPDRSAEPAPPGGVSKYGAIQIHNAYIVAPSEDGLIIVDQHALHERLIYNTLRRRVAESSLVGQKLLIPETLTVTPVEADCLQRHAELLGHLGVEAVPFGPNAVAVQRFPSMLVERQVPMAEFLREILDKLADLPALRSEASGSETGGQPAEGANPEQLLEDILAVLACKAAVKAGDPLTPGEIDSLLSRRESAEMASACPHGRPTTLRLSLRDLEKQFKRT